MKATLAGHAWLLVALGLALVIGELPLVLSACCAPPGATGVGTAWFVNDFAQYEAAMRQGAEQPGWQIRDVFTAEPHQAIVMFPLYVGLGKLASTLHVPAIAVERVLELVARAMLVFALWRFCQAFASGRTAARWAFGLALFGSGFELLASLIGGLLGNTVYSGSWAYEANGFGLLFAAPHVPLAMAATLELARDGLRPLRRVSAPWLLKAALLTAAVALLHPFHVPVLIGALALVGLVFWSTGRGAASFAYAVAALLGALPWLWSTVTTFSFDPFWFATYSSQNQLPSPLPHELLVDLGPTLVLAAAGIYLLRSRVAPFGLLVWLLLGLTAMYLPVPYQRRLSFGTQPALAILAANGLVAACAAIGARRAVWLRLGVVATAAGSTLFVLASVIASGFFNTPLPVYRSTRDLDDAASWLDTQARSGDVIVADWDVSNYLAPRTAARVYGGHPVATLDAAGKRFAISSVFVHTTSSLLVARQMGAQWLVYGPHESNLPGPLGPAFQAGSVRVYRVSPG